MTLISRFASCSALALSLCAVGCHQTQLASAPPPAPPAPSRTLASPWDATPVALKPQPYDCGPPVAIAPDLTVTRDLNSKTNPVPPSVQQAVYRESDAAARELSHRVVSAADNFRHSGSQEAAQCVVRLLVAAATNHAMDGYMASKDAWQEQNRTLRSVAIAYLKVRGSLRDANLLSPDDNALIGLWMDDIARTERDWIESGHCGPKTCGLHGHIGMGVAMAAAAVGVVSNDNNLFHWALTQYRTDVSYIDGRGLLRYDTHGEYALKYNILGTASLVQIAELGEVNGEPMYAYDDGRIHLLVHTVALGLVDPGPFSEAAHVEQRVHKTVEPWQVSWASIYDRRFPDPVMTGLLQQVGPVGADMWGGEPN